MWDYKPHIFIAVTGFSSRNIGFAFFKIIVRTFYVFYQFIVNFTTFSVWQFRLFWAFKIKIDHIRSQLVIDWVWTPNHNNLSKWKSTLITIIKSSKWKQWRCWVILKLPIKFVFVDYQQQSTPIAECKKILL
jgi:hypothetical protein